MDNQQGTKLYLHTIINAKLLLQFNSSTLRDYT
jgi:hypothetical protein